MVKMISKNIESRFGLFFRIQMLLRFGSFPILWVRSWLGILRHNWIIEQSLQESSAREQMGKGWATEVDGEL